MKPKLLLPALIIIVSCCFACNHRKDTISGNRTPLNELVDSIGINQEELGIYIGKSDYTLSVKANGVLLRKYSVVFGGNPVDDKLMEGDQCTPEGIFEVRDHYPHNSWSKFIWVNYPTEDSWKKHRKAKAEKQIPEDAEIGGEIGIHGVPGNRNNFIKNKRNWTAGCISLTTEDINDLYTVVFNGMKIEIVK